MKGRLVKMDKKDKKFDLILFDLDGTVFDTAKTILDTLKATVDYAGLRKLTDEEMAAFIGPPILQSFKEYYPGLGEEELTKLVEYYRAYYLDKELLKAELFPGVLDVLMTLKTEGYKVALATYKLMKCVTPLFDYKGVTKYFDTLRGSIKESGLTKADIMKLAMKDCGVTDVDRACMVGDTEYDLRGAIECNMPFIGVTYGAGIKGITEEEKNYKKYIALVDKMEDILKYV